MRERWKSRPGFLRAFNKKRTQTSRDIREAGKRQGKGRESREDFKFERLRFCMIA